MSKEGTSMEQDYLHPRVSVIIVTFNVESWIGSLLTSLACQTYPNFEIVVLDDASTDGTVGVVTHQHQIHVGIVTTTSNVGKCALLNSLLPLSLRSDYIVLLNAATTPEPTFIQNMVEFAKEQGELFGGATAQIIDRDSLIPYLPRRTRGVTNVLRNLTTGKRTDASQLEATADPLVVDSFWGCACILKSEMIDRLKFDEKLRVFGEEEDLSIRAKQKGYRFFWTRRAKVLYSQGASTTTNGVPNFARVYLGIRNQVYLAIKYYPLSEALLTIVATIAYAGMKVVRHPRLIRGAFMALSWNVGRLTDTLDERRAWFEAC